jgi:phage baseplate assembly protein W
MKSIKFPKMFGTNSTRVWQESEHQEATAQNIKLVLQSARGELLGDPYFGMLLQQYMFDQNSYILRDIITDMIYTQLAIFIPQLHLTRQGIKIFQNKRKGQLICQIQGINQIDYQPNTYELILFNDTQV